MEYPDLFAHIKSIVHRVMVLRWTTVAKHLTVPAFLERHQSSCGLLFDLAPMLAIIAAKEEWLSRCSDEVLVLQAQGGLGEALFTAKIKDIVESALVKHIDTSMTGLMANAFCSKTICSQVVLARWRDQIVEDCESKVKSLDLLPSCRTVTIPYRSGNIPGVLVSCLPEHIDFVIVARWKAAAIAQKKLTPLDAEEMLGYTASDEDLLLPLCPSFRAGLFLLLF